MTIRALLAVTLLVAGVAAGVPAAADATPADGTGSTAAATTNATTLSVRTLATPRTTAERLDSSGNVTALRRDGPLTSANAVPNNATLVVELGVPGLADEYAAANGSNATARFRHALRSANASLGVTHTNPAPELAALELDLVNASATRVVPDRANDTYYLVVNLTALNAARAADGSGTVRELHGDEEFRLNLSVPRSSPLAVSGSAATTVTVERREASVASPHGTVLLPQMANATVTGPTTLLPGTPVTVRLQVAGDDGFEATRNVTVTPSDGRGRYAATFDLSEVANGTPVAVQVIGPTGPLLYEPETGSVVEPTGSLELLDEPRHVDQSWVRVNAEFTHPSIVVLREGSRDGPVVGKRTLAPDANTHVRVELDRSVERDRTLVAVAVADLNGDHEVDVNEPLLTRNDSPVSDEMVFDPATTTATATSTTATTTSTATTGTPTTSDGQPGFGAGVGLAALAAAVLLARRHALR